jgi:hypothetical protein
MSDECPKRDSMSVEEATISNMWEIAAIVELLEQKGLCTKQDLYDIITEFRRTRIPVPTFLSPPSLNRTSSRRPRTRSSTTCLRCSTNMG